MLVERWQKEAEGIIIFNGLFSAVVAALVAVSLQDLKPNPQDTSAFYLEKIYQLQADPNASSPSTLAKPPTFSPPSHAVWVNSLWFLSLVISLSCAMLATLQQQWARRYLDNTRRKGGTPHDRARVRAFFTYSIFRFRVPWAVEVLNALVHLSLFTFFAGLLVHLCNTNHTVFSVVIFWVAFLSTLYGFITFMPFIWPDSPYYSPLTRVAGLFYIFVQLGAVKLYDCIRLPFCALDSCRRVRKWLELRRREPLRHDWEVKEAIKKQLKKIDLQILWWTIDFYHEDDKQEKVIEAIPGFFKSDKVGVLRDQAQEMIEVALGHFLSTALLSNTVPKSVRIRRLMTCLNAAREVQTSVNTLGNMFSKMVHLNWAEVCQSVEIGLALRSWDKDNNGRFTAYIQGVVAVIIASARECDESWAKLARDHLGIPDSVFQDYLAHGDSVLLANLIHFTRPANRSEPFVLSVVKSLPTFDICHTLPELQHDFCAMWNEVVQEAPKSVANSQHVLLLKEILHHFTALHQSTVPQLCLDDNLWGSLAYLFSYRRCNVANHCSLQNPTNDGHDATTANPEATATTPATPSPPFRSTWSVPNLATSLEEPSFRPHQSAPNITSS